MEFIMLERSHNDGYNTDQEEKKEEPRNLALCDISADDIKPADGQTGAAVKKPGIMRKLLLYISASVFIFCAAMFVYTLYDHSQAQDIYDDLDNFMFENNVSGVPRSTAVASDSPLPDFDSMRSFRGNTDSVSSTGSSLSGYIAVMRAKISSLKARNNDVVGYISVPNTKISYPIMHSSDNEYYLNHDYLGGYRLSGSIFLDYRNFDDIPINENSCIYGHNLTNGNMMNNIMNFLDEDFFNENKYVEIITEKGLYTYLIFAVYKTNMYSDYITTYFPTTEDVCEFARQQQERSLHKREGVEFKPGTKLLTLSTCTNVLQEERYTLQAVLVSHDE